MVENNRSNTKPARYIIAYNEILKRIREGIYPEGLKLPPESQLAEQLGVSRVTLRQALSMLQEDGLVEARQGVGTFIRKTLDEKAVGLEKKGGVLKKCGITYTHSVCREPSFHTTVQYTEEIFERELVVVFGMEILYYNEKELVGKSFSLIPTDIEEIRGMDLQDRKKVQNFIEERIYELAKSIQYRVSGVKENHLLTQLRQDKKKYYFLITEKIYGLGGSVICYNKYHFPMELVEIRFNVV